jgi:hypothetical protein
MRRELRCVVGQASTYAWALVKYSGDDRGREDKVKMEAKNQPLLLPLCRVWWAPPARRVDNRVTKITRCALQRVCLREGSGAMREQGEQGENRAQFRRVSIGYHRTVSHL